MKLHTDITGDIAAGAAALSPSSTRPAAHRGRRLRQRTLAVAAGIAAMAAVVAPSGADAAISGDRQSPEVVAAAEAALSAHSQLEEQPTASNGERFAIRLARAADATAAELGIDPAEMRAAWTTADEAHQVALLTGLSLLGTDYTTRGDDPEEGFDCSGFTSWAWRAAGIDIPRSSGDQIAAADGRSRDTAMAGDLVQYPGHVMMYLGVGNAVVHSSTHDKGVELWALSTERSYRFGDPTS